MPLSKYRSSARGYSDAQPQSIGWPQEPTQDCPGSTQCQQWIPTQSAFLLSAQAGQSQRQIQKKSTTASHRSASSPPGHSTCQGVPSQGSTCGASLAKPVLVGQAVAASSRTSIFQRSANFRTNQGWAVVPSFAESIHRSGGSGRRNG